MNSLSEIQARHPFEKNDWDHFHDAVYHATGTLLSVQLLEELFDKLSLRLRKDAEDWGMADTLWRDSLIEYLQANPGLV